MEEVKGKRWWDSGGGQEKREGGREEGLARAFHLPEDVNMPRVTPGPMLILITVQHPALGPYHSTRY